MVPESSALPQDQQRQPGHHQLEEFPPQAVAPNWRFHLEVESCPLRPPYSSKRKAPHLLHGAAGAALCGAARAAIHRYVPAIISYLFYRVLSLAFMATQAPGSSEVRPQGALAPPTPGSIVRLSCGSCCHLAAGWASEVIELKRLALKVWLSQIL